MSEKRFALEYDSNCYKCISDNEQKELYSSRESICDLLNSLNDELEESSDFIIEQRKENKTLKEENEQLKKEWLRIEQTVSSIQKEINDYYNEVCSNE